MIHQRARNCSKIAPRSNWRSKTRDAADMNLGSVKHGQRQRPILDSTHTRHARAAQRAWPTLTNKQKDQRLPSFTGWRSRLVKDRHERKAVPFSSDLHQAVSALYISMITSRTSFIFAQHSRSTAVKGP